MAIARSIALLLLCQLAGSALVFATGLPLPGAVIGIVLLLLTLATLGHASAALNRVAGLLLSHMSLLFIPAGTGVIMLLGLIEREWLPITVAMVVSTLLGMMTTALIVHTYASDDLSDD
ncbi:LrgA family protein [Luminiphilus syltensis NOR5-1B]|uniref:LrgA family protein n=1 Tax=Luminiphilus syltensis NOR5-1B TaxID=565045 RepID=B8KTR9_9GAMM|nr:CidA/LrgA family protein [Luminiphilus syltensis]EED34777.1 LrgA family protein [Luminiphilus syltensis NOR5-1B]